MQGFCRRFLPPARPVGSRLRYPQVLCIMCEASWSTLFFKVRPVLLWPLLVFQVFQPARRAALDACSGMHVRPSAQGHASRRPSLRAQVLEVLEQLLVQGDLLADAGAKQLPRSCPAARFLAALGETLAAEPPMGATIR